MKTKKHNITNILSLTHATSIVDIDAAIKQYVADNDITINDVVGYAAKIQGGAQTILSRSIFVMLEVLPTKLTYRKFLKSVGLSPSDISDQYYMDHVHATTLLKLLDETLSSQLRNKPVGILRHLAKLRNHPQLSNILNEYLEEERSVRDTAKFVSCYIAKPIIKAKEEEHKLALPDTPEDIEVKDNNGLYLELDSDGKIPATSKERSIQHIVRFISVLKSDYQIKDPAYKQLQSIISRLNDFATKNCVIEKDDDVNQMSFDFDAEGGTGDE